MDETPNTPPTNGGRITDEVRRDIDVCTQSGAMFDTVFIVKSALLCDLDRIDAAHEDALQHEHETAYDAGYDAGFASADDWLPKDADGEYIHVGDVMGHRDFPNAKYTVVGIGENAFFTRDGAGEIHKHIASLYPHYKLTVEDVLDEFASAYDRIGGEDEEHQKYLNLIAEYAAKLRLAGDAE